MATQITNVPVQLACPVCKADNPQASYQPKEMYYGTRQTFNYFQCSNCSALYLSDPPAQMSSFYPENYHCHTPTEPSSLSAKQRLIAMRDRSTLTGKGVIGQLMASIKSSPELMHTLSYLNLSLSSKILDIGCGGGGLLLRLKALGFKHLTGVDPYLPEGIDTRISGFELKRDTVESINGKFDGIILNHSLEHMFEHARILEIIKNLLEDKGKICIRIPLVGGKAWEEHKENWFQLDAPRHVLLHSEKSFRSLATDCGLSVDKVIYDSDFKQFVRSQLYEKDISSVEFLNNYAGNMGRFFTATEIEHYEKLSADSNQKKAGDQASFILSVS
ncbi:MAG: class I SAM-dependent methyltransferase [Phormidesmis sp.]